MRNLVGLALCVFVKNKLMEHVSDVMGGFIGVGVFGVVVSPQCSRSCVRGESSHAMPVVGPQVQAFPAVAFHFGLLAVTVRNALFSMFNIACVLPAARPSLALSCVRGFTFQRLLLVWADVLHVLYCGRAKKAPWECE